MPPAQRISPATANYIPNSTDVIDPATGKVRLPWKSLFDKLANAIPSGPVGGSFAAGDLVVGAGGLTIADSGVALSSLGTVTHTPGPLAPGNVIEGNGAGDVKDSGLPFSEVVTHTAGALGLNNIVVGNGASDTKDSGVPVATFAPIVFNVKSYGAIGNGIANDTAAINAAATAAGGAGGGIVWLPAGQYLTSADIVLPAGVSIAGASCIYSAIIPTTATQNGIVVDGTQGVTVSDLQILPNLAMTAGAGVLVQGTGSANNLTKISRVVTVGCYIGVYFPQVAYSSVDTCGFFNSVLIDCAFRNTATPGAGDWTVINCTFASAGAVGVYIASGGGARIINNKLVQGAYGIEIDLDGSIATVDLLVIGNSIENYTNGPIRFQSLAGTPGTFANVIIANNQIQGPTTGGVGSAAIQVGSTSTQWLTNVLIANNAINLTANTTTCIDVAGSGDVLIDGNKFWNYGAAGAGGTGCKGVTIQSTATDVKVTDSNKFKNGTTNAFANLFVNSSATSYVSYTDAWIAYTPAWGNTGTANTQGNATVSGKYTLTGRRCTFKLFFQFGSTSASGNGNWTFTLPFAAVNAATLDVPRALFEESGITWIPFTPVLVANSITFTLVNSAGVAMSGTTPHAVASGDQVLISGDFELP